MDKMKTEVQEKVQNLTQDNPRVKEINDKIESAQLDKKLPKALVIVLIAISLVLCSGTVAFIYIFARLIQPSL